MQSKIKITNQINTVGSNQTHIHECIEALMAMRLKLARKDVINDEELETVLHEAADLLLMHTM